MAKTAEVKRYLAYWFQLGKKLVIDNGAATVLPQQIFAGNGYSSEFEECWQKAIETPSSCHVEGTHETIAQLLQPEWEICSCVRCSMPVPVRNMGMPTLACPCNDLLTWPNTELPPPRSPIDSQNQLLNIRNRLINN
ncbi:MAG: hypothetical protein IGS39_11685 [Calothrix sp. C42_A2020_038]|nr:hypothetical protein [Calothrix sp. C42_A2020_038]